MDDSSGKRAGDDSGPHDAASARGAGESNLPVVWSPQLGAGEPHDDEAVECDEAAFADEAASDPAPDEAAPAPVATPPRSWRFAMLAGIVGLAAAFGSFIGAMSASGLAHLTSGPAPAAAVAAIPASGTADAGATLRALKSQNAELAAIKTALDGAIRNSSVQYGSISDRLDRVEHFAADPAATAKLAHIAETVDRLDKLNAAPETTGSIATVAPAAPANALPAEPKIADRILQDWIVQDVRGDRALVQSRYGGVFDVSTGSVLPGLGHVQSVKRQDGQWIVVTERGTIISAH
jgi:hypothetical protein